MRPAIVEYLTAHGVGFLAWLVPTPGVVYSIAFVAVVLLLLRRGRRAGIPELRLLELAVAGAVGGAVGTRLYYLLISGDIARLGVVQWFNPASGTASWGAYLGAAVGIVGYSRFVRTDALPYLDLAASCAPPGTLIGRWSCFLAGDDYGTVTSVPWAVSFPPGSFPFNAHVAAGLIPPSALASLTVHPLQLYLFLNGLLVFLVVSAVWRRHRAVPGRTLGVYFALYGATRFVWEFLRAPGAGGPDGFLSSSQLMSLLLLAMGSVSLWRRRQPAETDLA